MANWQVISLDTTTPQLRAPGTGDGYSFNSGSTQLGVWTTTGLGVGTASPVAKLAVQDSTAPKIALQVGATERAFLDYTQSTFVTRLDSDGPLSLASNNTEAIYLTSFQEVGVGTQTPDDKLSVAGNIGAAQTGTAGFKFYSAAPGSNALEWFLYNSTSLSNALQLSYYNSGVFGGTVLTANKSGNIGIGTSSPGSKLEVAGEIRASSFATNTFAINTNPITGTGTSAQQLRFKTTGADFYVGTESSTAGSFFPGSTAYAAVLYNSVSTPMQFYTAGTLRATLDSSGNLGIGTSSPSFRLDVQAARATSGMTSTTGTNDVLFRQTNTGGNFSIGIDDSGGTNYGSAYCAGLFHSGARAMLFGTNNTERMRLDSSGNVGIGTTGPVNKLSVLGKISASDSNFTASAYIHVNPDSGADRAIGQFSISGASNGLQINWNHASSKMHIIINNIPTSSAGLPSGTLYSDGGTIKIA